jgi:hypothetical protein
MLNELVDAGDSISDTAEAAATDGPLGDDSEPALDLIEPGMGWTRLPEYRSKRTRDERPGPHQRHHPTRDRCSARYASYPVCR